MIHTTAGISFQVADVIQSMVKDSGEQLTEMRVDGGGSMSVPMMQAQADLLGVAQFVCLFYAIVCWLSC